MLVVGKVTFGFEVIGVLKEQTSGMENGSAYIPRGFYSKKIMPNPNSDTVMVQAVSNQMATQLVDILSEYCTQKAGNSYAVRVTSMQSMLDQMSEITNTMSMLLLLFRC